MFSPGFFRSLGDFIQLLFDSHALNFPLLFIDFTNNHHSIVIIVKLIDLLEQFHVIGADLVLFVFLKENRLFELGLF